MTRPVWKALALAHVAVVALHVALTDGLGLALTALTLDNLVRLAAWLLPLAPAPWLLGGAAEPTWGHRTLLWVWLLLALGTAPLWGFAALWRANDVRIGNGDRPQGAVALDDGSRLVCFLTHDAGGLGGAWLRPAHVRGVLPGVERRTWLDHTAGGSPSYGWDPVRAVTVVAVGGRVLEGPGRLEC